MSRESKTAHDGKAPVTVTEVTIFTGLLSRDPAMSYHVKRDSAGRSTSRIEGAIPSQGGPLVSEWVHPKERIYFVLCLLVSFLAYAVLFLSLVGLVYIGIGLVVGLVAQGLFIGSLRGNGIRVSEQQFPEIHRMAERIAKQMRLESLPAIYVLQAGGLLNAFAARFLGRNFVVLLSDVLELAYAQGESAVAFVIAHELAHIKRKHLAWRAALYPAMMMPFLGPAYMRACEYTCDRLAAHCEPDGAIQGLLVLAAGKTLYGQVSVEAFARQVDEEGGFWVALAEVLSTHPNLPKRLRAVTGLKSMAGFELSQPVASA